MYVCMYNNNNNNNIDTLLPEIAPYCHLAYAEPSQLKFGKYTILSMVTGPQQGDPLGPLLFCLPLKPALLKLTSPLAFGYLDDISLGGPSPTVEADIANLELDMQTWVSFSIDRNVK